MNKRQLAKVLETAMPAYKAASSKFMCNEIKNLCKSGQLSSWQRGRALKAIKAKIAPEYTLPNYFRGVLKVSYRPEAHPDRLIAFYETWIAELKGEE